MKNRTYKYSSVCCFWSVKKSQKSLKSWSTKISEWIRTFFWKGRYNKTNTKWLISCESEAFRIKWLLRAGWTIWTQTKKKKKSKNFFENCRQKRHCSQNWHIHTDTDIHSHTHTHEMADGHKSFVNFFSLSLSLSRIFFICFFSVFFSSLHRFGTSTFTDRISFPARIHIKVNSFILDQIRRKISTIFSFEHSHSLYRLFKWTYPNLYVCSPENLEVFFCSFFILLSLLFFFIFFHIFFILLYIESNNTTYFSLKRFLDAIHFHIASTWLSCSCWAAWLLSDYVSNDPIDFNFSVFLFSIFSFFSFILSVHRNAFLLLLLVSYNTFDCRA